MARRTAPALLCAALLAVAAIALFGGGGQHRLRAVFAAALQVVPGQQVRVAGRGVGDVESVSLYDGQALVTMSIDDGQWPLHAGTVAQLRFGGALAYASRYVQLTPGPAGGPPLAENALLPRAQTITPVEFDQIFGTFDTRTRRNLGGVIIGADQTVAGHSADIARDLTLGSSGVSKTAGLVGDLAGDPAALGALVTAGAQTLTALRFSNPQLQGAVSNAAQTFTVLADNAGALGASVDRLPVTLAAAQRTLAHFDRSLVGLGALVTDLRPGAAGLVSTAPILGRVLSRLRQIAPLAERTLTTGTQALPLLGGFLGRARPLLPGISVALTRLAPMLACVRPYTPEIGGWFGTWQGGPLDTTGHYGRIDIIQTPVSPGTTLTSAQAVAQSNGTLRYAFPRPPGLNAGRPWFQPQCGAGPQALDPRFDPEAGR